MQAVVAPSWQIVYNGMDISDSLMPMMVRLQYQEAIGGRAAQLAFQVQDAQGLWQQSSYPKQGDTVTATLGYLGIPLIPCGTFEVDEFELSGPPDVFTIRCIEAGISQALRSSNSVAYENQTLTEIANTIALRHGFTLVATPASPDVVFKRITQRLESDLAFLHRIASAHNYDFTIRNNQLVFYSRTALESAPPVGTLTRSDISRFRFTNQALGSRTYREAVVSYLDPVGKTLLSATASEPSAPTADAHKAVVRVENAQQATLKAQSNLHVSNMLQVTSDITLPGTMAWRAGNTMNIAGFGMFDAYVYIVREALHEVGERGYTTTLSLRTVVSQSGNVDTVATGAG